MLEAMIGPLIFVLGAGLPTALLVILPDLLREKPDALIARLYREETEQRRLEHMAANARIRPLLKPGTPDVPFNPNDRYHRERIKESVNDRLAALGIDVAEGVTMVGS